MDLSVDYQLLSSTRYDSCLLNLPWNTLANGGMPSPYLLLKYNFDRLLDAAQKHAWTNAQGWTLIDLKNVCDDAVRDALFKLQTSDAPLKVIIVLDFRRGILSYGQLNLSNKLDPYSPQQRRSSHSYSFSNRHLVRCRSMLILPTPIYLGVPYCSSVISAPRNPVVDDTS